MAPANNDSPPSGTSKGTAPGSDKTPIPIGTGAGGPPLAAPGESFGFRKNG
eukprot:CAMPEP_0184303118 /NCGR_PEP_ID=MMETSP1049-20130417/12921_1 /TAXON_ID=77928 /ORGANISM="Proteomonas sulcata, Strain CCMP704" /LENGTH=50 /DNA_ID=CAMNT_0026614557 /DNA_START=561 /DNA_END=713 /DNA_ORIENTATION=+